MLCAHWDFYPAIGRDVPVFGHPQMMNQGSLSVAEFRQIVLDARKKYNVYEWGLRRMPLRPFTPSRRQ